MVMGDDAAYGGPGDRMPRAPDMPGNAASGRAADASLRENRRCADDEKRKSEGKDRRAHGLLQRKTILTGGSPRSMNSP
jgi:hypothetical protein